MKVNVRTEQLNAFYNPRLSSNGGGYDQPLITCTMDPETLIIEDLSCGDFGADISVWLTIDGSTEAKARYGSRAPEEFSTFTWSSPIHSFWLYWVEEHLNYHIPTREDLTDDQAS